MIDNVLRGGRVVGPDAEDEGDRVVLELNRAGDRGRAGRRGDARRLRRRHPGPEAIDERRRGRARLVDRSTAIELQRRGLAAFVRLLARGSASSSVVRARRSAGRDRAGLPRPLGDQLGRLPRRRLARGGARGAGSRAGRGRGTGLDGLGARGRPRSGRHAGGGRPPARRNAGGDEPRPGAAPGAWEAGGLDWDDRASTAVVARINDLAYGFEDPTFGTAMIDLRSEPPLRLYQAREDGEPVSVLGDDRRRRRLRHLPRRHRSRDTAARAWPAASCTPPSPRRAIAACAPRPFRRPSSATRCMSGWATRRSARCQMWERRKPGPALSPARSLALNPGPASISWARALTPTATRSSTRRSRR